MEEYDMSPAGLSPVSPNAPTKNLRSNAIQRKINEINANNEKTLQATAEVLTSPTYLAPPRRISETQLSGSLPNISFNHFPGDLVAQGSPYDHDNRSSPSPMRHMRSVSPRTVPFPCGGHPRRQPDMAGSPNHGSGLSLSIPSGYSQMRANSHSNLVDLPSPGELSPLSDPSLVSSLHPPLVRKRSQSYSPLTTLSPDEEMPAGYGMNILRQIPVPNLPNMPWTTRSQIPQITPQTIPIPNIPQFTRGRRCGCGPAPNRSQLQLSTPGHSHAQEQYSYNGHASPYSNPPFLSPNSSHHFDTNLSRSSSSSSFDGGQFGPPRPAYASNNTSPNTNPAGFNGINIPNYHISPAYSPSASMANLSINCNGYSPVDNVNNIQPAPSYQHNFVSFEQSAFPTVSVNETLFHRERTEYSTDFSSGIPNVIITEPNDALTGPLSPTAEALDRVFAELFGMDPAKMQMESVEVVDGMDYTTNGNSSQMADDLAILNEIALREMHDEPTRNWIR